MLYDVEVNGQFRQVSVTGREGRFAVVIGDREWIVDASMVGSHLLSLLIEPAAAPASSSIAAPVPIESAEVSVADDPVTGQFVYGLGTLPLAVGVNTRRRWERKVDAAQNGSGPQRLVAPMPGKVLRVLARTGDTVVHRQPVMVIEAMKMENELRATRDGKVTDVLVLEGQSVEAGTLLAIVTPS